MEKRILLLLGNPDPGATYCRALASAYAEGARAGGHALRFIDVATLEFPWLRSKAQFQDGAPPPAIAKAQADLAWANHLVIVYPLWLGSPPALLKAFFEQLFRPGFAHATSAGKLPRGALHGKSARVFVTMGMPAAAYRWFFLAHGQRALTRNVLKFCGIAPVRETFIGNIEAKDPAARQEWLLKALGLGQGGR